MRRTARQRPAMVLLATLALLTAACATGTDSVRTATPAAPAPTSTSEAPAPTSTPSAPEATSTPSAPAPTSTTQREQRAADEQAEPPPTPGGPVVGIDEVRILVPGFATIRGWVGTAHGPTPEVLVTLDGEPVAQVAAADGPADGASGAQLVTDVAVGRGEHTICLAPTGDGEPGGPACTGVVMPDVDVEDPTVIRLTGVDPAPPTGVTVRGVVTGAGPDVVHTVLVSTDQGVLEGHAARAGRIDVRRGTFRFGVAGLSAGTHRVCPHDSSAVVISRPDPASNPGGGASCGSVVIGPLAVGTTGDIVSSAPVGPPEGHPLHDIERDAGVAALLSDGSTFWVFGDSAARRADGSYRYFVNNTAAWASADAPHVTHDAVTPAGAPVLFAEPPDGSCADARFPKPALWPESAIVVPRPDGTDRVVVFMCKVCLGPRFLDIEDVGLAVAEYVYDPDAPPIGEPITGVITQRDLAPTTARYGRAAVLGVDGFVYGHECGVYPDRWGPCHVARVRPEMLTVPSAWTYWNGGEWTAPTSWSADVDDAAAMVVPSTTTEPYPVAAFDLEHLAEPGIYAMAYSPWPGFCGLVSVRLSETPVGPWTEPVEVTLPGCREEVDGEGYYCYAGTLQPALCDADVLGLGYFDMLVAATRAEYRAIEVPFTVVSATP